MSIARISQRFPTRNYPYAAPESGLESVPQDILPVSPPAPNQLHRFVLGLDAVPSPMTDTELAELEDPFGKLLRSGSPFPLTLRDVQAAINRLNGTPDALPNEQIFLVADGGHIPWTPATEELARAFRFVVARGSGVFSLLISASTNPDSSEDDAFLQIIGWDAVHEVFHYYERRAGTWFWAGNSLHALEPPTRGRGPFDSHVNGSLVMKELRAPWVHWHAPQAAIVPEALAPDDPLRTDPLFVGKVTAERLEQEVVRPGIRRWNRARVRRAVSDQGVWERVPTFLRQVITDTTVNLATTAVTSAILTDATPLLLPLGFFLNQDTLFDTLALFPDDPETSAVVISGRQYRECLARYDVHRTDGAFRVEGDVNFAFLTPEPAFEDTDLLDALIQAGLVSPRFAACLTMTDFCNPTFSRRRAALLRHVPDTVQTSDSVTASDALETAFVAAVEAASGDGDSPEAEFLARRQTADWEVAFRAEITNYLLALKSAAQDDAVVDGWFRLAESRRRLFRRRKLAEFRLTTPQTNIAEDAPALRMRQDGSVEVAV